MGNPQRLSPEDKRNYPLMPQICNAFLCSRSDQRSLGEQADFSWQAVQICSVGGCARFVAD
jgi:hypothetical protein